MKKVLAFLSKKLTLIGCLALFAIQMANAQCEVNYSIVGNSMVFNVVNPTPYITYSWSGTFGLPFSGTGTSIVVPIPNLPKQLTINLYTGQISNPCWQLGPISVEENCTEGNGFSFVVNGCSVVFTRDPLLPPGITVLSSSWSFGDGTPSSSESNPVHNYPPPGGTFQASLVTVILYNNLQVMYICRKNVTTSCNDSGCSAPPSAGFTTLEYLDCCVLKVSLNADCDECTHFWKFGDCATSTDPNPVFPVENVSTYVTPTINIFHKITCPGQPDYIVNFTYNFEHQGIFVGTAGDPTSAVSIKNVINCGTGALLFPNNSINNPGPLNINVYSTLVIDNSYSFNADHFCMDPCTGIDIAPNKSLTINNGTVIEGSPVCKMTWRGIQVSGQNGFLGLQDATIKDAIVGVRAMGVNSKLDLTGSQFINNFVGFAAETNFVLQGNTPFNGNTFKSTGQLYAKCGDVPVFIGETYNALRPFAGVFLLNSALNISNSLPQSSPPDAIPMVNTFSYLANGIFLKNSNGKTIRECNFDHMIVTNGFSNSGNGIMFLDGTGGHELVHEGGIFSLVKTGIFANIFGPNSKFVSKKATMGLVNEGFKFISSGSLVPYATSRSRVEQATVTSTDFGLSFNVAALGGNTGFVNQLDVRNSTFNAIAGHGVILQSFVPLQGQSGPPVQDIIIGGESNFLNTISVNSHNSAPKRGVWVNNFNGGRVSYNNITIEGSNNFGQGISLEGGGGTEVFNNNVTGNYVYFGNVNHTDGIFTGNSIGNKYYNNNFSSTYYGMRFLGNCLMTDNIRCNTMANHQYGMYYNSSSPAATTTGTQTCGMNSWGQGILHGAVYDGSLGDAMSSLYTTNPGAPDFPNSVFPQGWFVTGSCSASCPANFAGGDNPSDRESNGTDANAGMGAGEEDNSSKLYPHNNSLSGSSIISIYPNPASTSLHLNMGVDVRTQVTITVFDAIGRVCLKKVLDLTYDASDIDVSGLSPGIYHLTVKNGDEILHSQKIAIVR
ncbi:MAG: T9SS type A sorting domain-containing protein [Saprospiraceae bacterium]|nr:T9SS type A sorting domain-containing protein [Saprospiraceae bacterium]